MPYTQSSYDGWRLSEYFDVRVDIYEVAGLTISAEGRGLPEEAPDTPTFVNVPAAYLPTPDYEEIQQIVLQTQNTDLTQDRFHFLIDQSIKAGDMILMQTPSHSLYHRVWVVQGESQDFNNVLTGIPVRQMNYKQVFAKLSPGLV